MGLKRGTIPGKGEAARRQQILDFVAIKPRSSADIYAHLGVTKCPFIRALLDDMVYHGEIWRTTTKLGEYEGFFYYPTHGFFRPLVYRKGRYVTDIPYHDLYNPPGASWGGFWDEFQQSTEQEQSTDGY